MTDTAEAPGMGHNRPPKTPFELAEDRIETLNIEADNWLDGEAIENQGQADAVARLVSDARKAFNEADTARKIENAPFDTGKAEVQGRYKPLLRKADNILKMGKKLLTPFFVKIDAEKRAVAEQARKDADEAADKARAAFEQSNVTDLDAREVAERYADDAQALNKTAKHAAKDKAAAKGGQRAVTLRSTWTPTITDLAECARYYWATDQAGMGVKILEMAQRDVMDGKRDIPGVEITERRVAV